MGYATITATRASAGAGNSHRACRCPQRATAPLAGPGAIAARLALGAVEQVLAVLLGLGQHLRGRRALDRLLDGHADDVAVLGDPYDLRQPLSPDPERRLVGLVPVGGHLRLGLDLRAVPRGRATHAHASHQLADSVGLV